MSMRLRLRYTTMAVTLAALWIIVPALSALHLALEDHVYCTEHGALEEQGEVHPDEVIAEAADDRLHAPAAGRNGASHQTCAHGQLATRDEVVFAPPVTQAGVAKTETQSPGRAYSALCSLSVLSVAPKNSPPIAF